MFLINETSRIDAYACPPARSRVANTHSEMSPRTHFQPDISTSRLLATASLEALQQLAPHDRARPLPHRVTPPEGTRCLKPVKGPVDARVSTCYST
jgi:hypothetical protein